MIAHSKPIALPHTSSSHLASAEGSYTDDSNGVFNPASFTRHFQGSPISWRASSFTNRFSASPTAHLLSSIDVTGKTPMDDSILNAVNVFDLDREGELCRNYTCCNLQLNDLHALLEHFEQVHIVVLDSHSAPHIQIPFNPTVHDTKKPFVYDPDDMELDIDLGTHVQPLLPTLSSQSSPSPPDTPIFTPLSNYPSLHTLKSNHLYPPHSPYISQPPSPLSTNYDPTSPSSFLQDSPTCSIPNHLNLSLLASHGFPRATPNTNLPNPEEAFNPYARFASDYSSSMPGALFNGATIDEASALHGVAAWQVQQQEHQQQQQIQQTQEGCVPPALLFSTSTHKHQGQNISKNNLLKALSTSSLHRHQYHSASQPTSPSTTSHSHSLSRPGSLLLCKPFRCPKPNCNKSYKQANGLKYHMTHGSCNFAPPKDLEHVKDLLERKRREREGMNAENGSGLTRSASVGSAPVAEQQSPSSSHPSPNGTSPATTPPPSNSAAPSPPSSQSSPALQSPVRQNDRLSPSAILTYSDLSNISEHDLREVEREAERRLRPYACSVGDCQRRYKNMNGLRYHYQHSGDHGAAGLALLSSGQHECLSTGKRTGSVSVPVSRGGSHSVGNSRTGTPQPLLFGLGIGSAVDVKPDVGLAPATAPVGGAQSQAQAQAQAYHQLQLQQFQQQRQQPHPLHLTSYHYAHLQGQYQGQAQSHLGSPLTPTFASSVSSPVSPTAGDGVPGIKNPTLPMEFNIAMGLGTGMSVDVGLGGGSTAGSTLNGGDSGMEFNNSGMMFDNGMGDVNMGYGMHGMEMGMLGDMGGFHQLSSPLGGQQPYHQIENGMSS